MTIRRYAEADRENVIYLLRLNTPAYFSPTEEEDLIDYLDHHAAHYYVMDSGSGLVGCGGINFVGDPPVVRISWDIFHPDYQGKGLGRMLTEFRIEKIKEYPNIQIIVVRTSQLAYKFYEKLGFELQEIVKNYWADGFDLYLMEQTTGHFTS